MRIICHTEFRLLMKLLITAILFPFTLVASAQYLEKTGDIRIFTDPRIDQLATEYPLIATQIHSLDGFRVQIFFDSGNLSKRNASQAREDFIKRYPEVAAYITFREPFYRVRVGNFRTKLEADGFRKKILHYYPHAFTVNDQITPAADY